MSGNDPAAGKSGRGEARRWLAIAVEDRTVAVICVEKQPPVLGVAAYHCQQSIKKLLKGILIVAGVHFPKTHDLRTLSSMAELHVPAGASSTAILISRRKSFRRQMNSAALLLIDSLAALLHGLIDDNAS